MNKPEFTWYEFFAGGGMGRLGLGQRWRCLFANEWCEKKATAYRARFGASEELVIRDVAKVSTGELPGRADLVWASFPCQDLSLAGSGAGLKGERSGTFLAQRWVRCLKFRGSLRYAGSTRSTDKHPAELATALKIWF
jgi:DNA (cytosine-5)-methyltransferase 1